jgi:hypothetical protein
MFMLKVKAPLPAGYSLPANPPFYLSRATSYARRRSQTFCARPPNGSVLLTSPNLHPPRGRPPSGWLSRRHPNNTSSCWCSMSSSGFVSRAPSFPRSSNGYGTWSGNAAIA